VAEPLNETEVKACALRVSASSSELPDEGRKDGRERRASERGKRGMRAGTDRGGRGDVVAGNAVVEETELIGRESMIIQLEIVHNTPQGVGLEAHVESERPRRDLPSRS
jgi:hypothetical protein